MTNQELRNERDMLDGNLNRIMITDDLTELHTMYDFAKERLTKLYESRRDVLRDRAMLKIKEKNSKKEWV